MGGTHDLAKNENENVTERELATGNREQGTANWETEIPWPTTASWDPKSPRDWVALHSRLLGLAEEMCARFLRAALKFEIFSLILIQKGRALDPKSKVSKGAASPSPAEQTKKNPLTVNRANCRRIFVPLLVAWASSQDCFLFFRFFL